MSFLHKTYTKQHHLFRAWGLHPIAIAMDVYPYALTETHTKQLQTVNTLTLCYNIILWTKLHNSLNIIVHNGTALCEYLTTRQIWGIWKLRPAYGPETPNLDQNRWCFVPYDLEISWMTLENNRASLLCCFKLCASFRSHRWFQTGDTVRKRPIWVKNRQFLEPCDLEIWDMTLKNNRAPLLYYFKLCASFPSHRWFQTGDTVRKPPIWVKIDDF